MSGRADVVRGMTVLAWATLAWAAATGPGLAAPFCIQTQLVPPQCLYYDVRECQSRANRLHGSCSANLAEVRLQPGSGGFCIARGSAALPARCDYVDLGSCLREAARSGGACFATPRPTGIVEQGQGNQSNPSQSPPAVPGDGFGFGTTFSGTHP